MRDYKTSPRRTWIARLLDRWALKRVQRAERRLRSDLRAMGFTLEDDEDCSDLSNVVQIPPGMRINPPTIAERNRADAERVERAVRGAQLPVSMFHKRQAE